MFRTDILICYDGSAAADAAIDQAASLFPGADAVVLTVWQPFDSLLSSWSVMAGGLGQVDEDVEASALTLATKGAQRARAGGLRVQGETLRAPGSIAKALMDWAAEARCKVIVLGSVGHSALYDALLGSVANKVVHAAPIPVLVVPAPATQDTGN